MRKPKTLNLYYDSDGVALMRIKDCGISFLVLALDQIPLVRLQGSNIPTHIEVTRALAWYEKELLVATSSKEVKRYAQAIAKLKEGLALDPPQGRSQA